MMCSTTMSAAECIEIPEMERQINQLEEIEGEINELVFKHWVVKRKIDELEMDYRQIEDENPPFDVMVDDPNYDDAIEHMGMIQDRIDDLMVELHDIQEKIDEWQMKYDECERGIRDELLDIADVIKEEIDELEMEYRQIEDENPPFDVMVDDPNYDDAIEHMGMIQDRIDDLMVELHDIQEKIDNCDI